MTADPITPTPPPAPNHGTTDAAGRGNLFQPLAGVPASSPALLDPASVPAPPGAAEDAGDDAPPPPGLTHGALRARAARVQAWMAQEDPDGTPPPRPLWLAGEPADWLLPAFIAAGAMGRTAVVADPRWDPERAQAVHQAVTAALGLPLALPPAPEAALPPGPPPENARLALDPAPKRPFYAGFTSGTSGLPKGILRGHRSWIETLAAGREAFGLPPGGRWLVLGPPAHSLVLYGALQALALGGGLRLGGLPDPWTDTVIGVPPLLATLARKGPWPKVARVLSAGQALDPATQEVLARTFPRARIIDFYGTTEQSFIAWRQVEGPPTAADPPGLVGRPFPGLDLRIVPSDPTDTAPGPDRPGRILVASPMVFDGYLPGLAEGGFARDGAWTTVGDRGWLDPAGRLHLAGREGGMVVVRGVNVYPEAVEARLKALPGVAEAAVVGLPDPRHGARLVALIERTAPPDSAGDAAPPLPDPAHLDGLTPEQRPRRLITVTDLPRRPSGKLDRAALVDLALRLLETDPTPDPPSPRPRG